jgi:hypothetical protein
VRDPRIERIDVRACRIPTDDPEADGTLAWSSTTIVLVQVAAAGERGLGYTYTHASAAQLIATELEEAVLGTSALAPPANWRTMVGAARNFGHQGIAASAIAAVDIALLGPQGAPPRPAARNPARAESGRRPRLWQRRVQPTLHPAEVLRTAMREDGGAPAPGHAEPARAKVDA